MKRANKIAACIIWAVCAVFFYMIRHLKVSIITYEPGPRLFPYIIIGMMAFLAIFIFFERVDDEKEEKRTSDPDLPPLREILVFFLIFVLGIVLIYMFGFIVGAFVGLYGMLLLAMPKKWLKNLIITALMVVAIYLLFRYVLLIPLPKFHLL